MPKFDRYDAVITPAGTDIFLVKQGGATKIMTLSQIEEFYPRCLTLKTGQTIKYHDGDDGDFEKGVAKSYTILATGQYSGTTNIVINGKTHALSNNCVKDDRTGLMWTRHIPTADIGPGADGKLFWSQWTLENKTDISFSNATGKINSVAGEFSTAALSVGRKFTVAGSTNNDGTYTVSVITANDITTVEGVVNEAAGASITIATVDDLIWDVVNQANINNFGGHNDWTIANRRQIYSLVDIGVFNPTIDMTAFPSIPTTNIWTSSSTRYSSSHAYNISFNLGNGYYAAKKTVAGFVWLVRDN